MGNKVDLAESDRKVTRDEVEEWIKSCSVTVSFLLYNNLQGMHYFETSAKENIGITEAVLDVLKKAISQKGEEEEYDFEIQIISRFVQDVIDLDGVKPATSDKCNC